MTTVRVAQRARFAAVDKRTVADDRLSYRALGVLTWLLDKPDDWSCDSSTIARPEGREGRDAVRAALNELARCGYIVRSKHQGEGGRWTTETLVYERPPTPDSQASDALDITESQASVIQASDSQALRTETDTKTKEPPVVPLGDPPKIRKRAGTPCPEEFKLNPEDREWAEQNAPTVDVTMSTKQFVTYWRSTGGLKVRWKQAWRNWLLKDEQRNANGRQSARTFL